MKKSQKLLKSKHYQKSAQTLAKQGEKERADALHNKSVDLKLRAKSIHPDGPRDRTRTKRAKSLAKRNDIPVTNIVDPSE